MTGDLFQGGLLEATLYPLKPGVSRGHPVFQGARPPQAPLQFDHWFHVPPRYANGRISATGDPIHFMFGSRVGFSGSADRMALFPVTSNPIWRQAAILDNATAHSIQLYSAHRAVIFATTQLSCMPCKTVRELRREWFGT